MRFTIIDSLQIKKYVREPIVILCLSESDHCRRTFVIFITTGMPLWPVVLRRGGHLTNHDLFNATNLLYYNDLGNILQRISLMPKIYFEKLRKSFYTINQL